MLPTYQGFAKTTSRIKHVSLTTFGRFQSDPRLLQAIESTPRQDNTPIFLVDIALPIPTLAIWENYLHNLPKAVSRKRTRLTSEQKQKELEARRNAPPRSDIFFKERLYVVTPRKFGPIPEYSYETVSLSRLPRSILVRPGAKLPPTTPLLTLKPINVPKHLQGFGRWFSTIAPSYGWKFSPNWKFPQWILALLPNRQERPRGFTFYDLSSAGLDSLLADYAGIIDRGNNFALKENSPIQENIKCYLRYRYGGEDGLEKQIDLWLQAKDAREQGGLSICYAGLYQDAQANLLPRTKVEMPLQIEFDKAEGAIRDAVFMGGTQELEFANDSRTRQIFEHNGRTLRRYHEGSPIRRMKKLRVEDDPSPMITCGYIRDRGDLLKFSGENKTKKRKSKASELSNFTAPPEGTVFFEQEDWTPGPEHLHTFLSHLEQNKTEYEVEVIPSGYYKLPSPEELSKQPEHTKIKKNWPFPHVLFVSSQDWFQHWSSEQRRMIPGVSNTLNFFEKQFWQHSPGGVLVSFFDTEGTPRTLFFKKTEQVDSTIFSKRKRQQLINKKDSLPERALRKVFRKKVDTEGNVQWLPPTSFTNHSGKLVVLTARPQRFSSTDWNTWKRAWTSLNTIEQLLREERWERLAFHTELPLILEKQPRIIDEQDLYESEYAQNEAEKRINDFLDELLSRVSSTSLDEDIKDDFYLEVKEIRKLIKNSIAGRLGLPRHELTLNDMNPPCANPPLRYKTPNDSVEAMMLETERELYRRKPTSAEPGDILRHKIFKYAQLERIRQKGWMPPMTITTPVVTIPGPIKQKRTERMVKVALAFQTISGDYPPEEKRKAKQLLTKAEGDNLQYSGPGRRLAMATK